MFDRLWPVSRVVRNLKVRALHAVGFEAGFIDRRADRRLDTEYLSWAQAFMLEIGFFLFFLPYTMAYNWLYDTLRQRWFSGASKSLAPNKASSARRFSGKVRGSNRKMLRERRMKVLGLLGGMS